MRISQGNPREIRFSTPAGKSAPCATVVPRIGIDPATVPISHTRESPLKQALPWWLTEWGPYSSLASSDSAFADAAR
jgi:hypothetical protein